MKKKKSRRPPPRGVDFLIRNEQGRWAEDLIIETINATDDFQAVRYGLSRAIMVKCGKEWAKYWERYQEVEKYGKRPDIIIFEKKDYYNIRKELESLSSKYGDSSLIPEDEWEKYIKDAVCAIEVEMSLWKASKMPHKDMKLPLKKKSVVAPMIWVKEDDAFSLEKWYNKFKKCIYVVQVFYDMAYIAPLFLIIEKARKILSVEDKKERNEIMKREGLIITTQKFIDERTGVATERTVYRLHPAIAKEFGRLKRPPNIELKIIEDERGKILPFLKFSNGLLEINQEILNWWKRLKS